VTVAPLHIETVCSFVFGCGVQTGLRELRPLQRSEHAVVGAKPRAWESRPRKYIEVGGIKLIHGYDKKSILLLRMNDKRKKATARNPVRAMK
jgi:hypothetical protein